MLSEAKHLCRFLPLPHPVIPTHIHITNYITFRYLVNSKIDGASYVRNGRLLPLIAVRGAPAMPSIVGQPARFNPNPFRGSVGAFLWKIVPWHDKRGLGLYGSYGRCYEQDARAELLHLRPPRGPSVFLPSKSIGGGPHLAKDCSSVVDPGAGPGYASSLAFRSFESMKVIVRPGQTNHPRLPQWCPRSSQGLRAARIGIVSIHSTPLVRMYRVRSHHKTFDLVPDGNATLTTQL
jgi:hypothetical protein